MERKFYEINKRYRDLKTTKNKEDEFCRWINLPLKRGISNARGIRIITRPSDGKIELLVFVSRSSGRSRSENPWQDQIDLEAGRIKYWGDGKAHDEKKYDQCMSNSWIKKVYTNYYAKEKRSEAPPY